MAQALTAEAILDTAEEVLRRYGPAKATVVDVARALQVSHGSVYRHFPSKAALRDAVTERWLHRVSEPLQAVAEGPGSAGERLHAWLLLLASSKQGMAAEDPELFATFSELTLAARDVVAAHVDDLVAQLAQIVGDGMATGEFAAGDPGDEGRAVLHATARFHHPALAGEWTVPGLAAELEAVFQLVMRGLASRPSDLGPQLNP